MKKMKIMLLSFALLAVVGSALAFKAKFTKNYCTADPEASPNFCKIAGLNKACPNIVQLTTAPVQTNFYCYTTPIAGRTDCKKADGVTDLQCITTTTSFKVD
jgi:uncharacterized membrane protein